MTPRNNKGELLARWRGTNEIVALAGVTEKKLALDLISDPGNDVSVRSVTARDGFRLIKASELEVPLAS